MRYSLAVKWLVLAVALASGAAATGCAQMPGNAPLAQAVEPAVRAKHDGAMARPVAVVEQHVTEERWHPPIDVDEATYVRRGSAARAAPRDN